jgi:hypothetical protein
VGEMELDKLIRETNDIFNITVLDPQVIERMKSYINVSEKHKIILWLWKKCGTEHMTKIMNNFDFKHYKIQGDKLILTHNWVEKNHDCNLFIGNENYKILAAVRNPYTRVFSDYTFNRIPQEFTYTEENKEKFRVHVYKIIIHSEKFFENCMDFDGRTPDYAVRLENLYEDYSKIPFIVESEYYKSGELKKAITQKVNVSNEDETLWKKFYTQEIADIVYYRMPRYFDLFGYDKNSWKK